MYTMKQVTQETGLSAPTLRYYEKEQLLPPIDRDSNGLRIYDEISLKSIYFVKALRATDMPIREIKEYVKLHEKGEETLQLRKSLLENHQAKVEEDLKAQALHLKKIKEKIKLYDEYVKNLEIRSE